MLRTLAPARPGKMPCPRSRGGSTSASASDPQIQICPVFSSKVPRKSCPVPTWKSRMTNLAANCPVPRAEVAVPAPEVAPHRPPPPILKFALSPVPRRLWPPLRVSRTKLPCPQPAGSPVPDSGPRLRTERWPLPSPATCPVPISGKGGEICPVPSFEESCPQFRGISTLDRGCARSFPSLRALWFQKGWMHPAGHGKLEAF